MVFRLAPTDFEMLGRIAEYRIMTSPQLAALLSRSKKGVRDRMSKLIAEGLLEETARGRGQHRGRPERVVFLSKSAVTILTRTSRNQRGLDKRLTPHEVSLLLRRHHPICATAISLPTVFRGREVACSRTKDLARAGPSKDVAKSCPERSRMG